MYMLGQGHDSALGLDIMLLKQQLLSVSGQAVDQARQHQKVTYMYRTSHLCCNFFLRNWLSGSPTTMLKSWMCRSDLTRHNPGVQRHSIKFCRHASSLMGRETTFTPSRQLSSSQICIAGLWAPVVTHSIWNTINYSIYIHGLTRSCSLQDCLATIPPHPFYIGEHDDNYDVAE